MILKFNNIIFLFQFQNKRIAESVERIMRRSNSRMNSECISEESEVDVKKQA